MTKSRILTVVLALTSGFAGSLLTRFVTPPAAFAQNQLVPKPTQEIRAESFTIVDRLGRTVGTFGSENGPANNGHERSIEPRIVLRDADGREIWSAGGMGIQPLSER